MNINFLIDVHTKQNVLTTGEVFKLMSINIFPYGLSVQTNTVSLHVYICNILLLSHSSITPFSKSLKRFTAVVLHYSSELMSSPFTYVISLLVLTAFFITLSVVVSFLFFIRDYRKSDSSHHYWFNRLLQYFLKILWSR